MGKSSQISGFYKLAPAERLEVVKNFAGLSGEEVDAIRSMGGLHLGLANRMIENVVGAIALPLGVAVNFLIDGKEYLVPMAIEEPSVVAAASNAAKMARVMGGFSTSNTGPVMIGQVQVVDVRDPYRAKMDILAAKEEILAKANEKDPLLVSLGGGARDLGVRVLDSLRGPIVVAELYIDCRDAMGANAVNTMAEAVAPVVERVSRGKVCLRIVSNLADRRLVRAKAIFAREAVGGDEAVEGILDAYAFAAVDPYRCTTHNKGIMNGVIAVALATGNDTRALEAGAHAYAAKTGSYRPLTVWEKDERGDLVGTIELPLAVGLVGGATRVHPVARACVKILGVSSSLELASVMASVGLAQNLAALRALAVEGIQRGHMKLHARNVAVMAGAPLELVDEVARRMVEDGMIRMDRAKEILGEIIP